MSRIKRGGRFRKGFLMLVVIILLLVVIGFLLPSKFHVERSIEIKRAPSIIFPYLNNIQRWSQWTSLNEGKDFSTEISYFGPPQGIGSGMEYSGDKLGAGKIEITDNESDQWIDFSLLMNKRISSKGHIEIDPINTSLSQVTISLEGDVGFHLPNRYIILFMDNISGALFDNSLKQLKSIIEVKNTTSPRSF
ncbi:MAG: SRPBCC family protein [Cytophagales bacterium]|nr:SRPBCC family protein [Cytophaga sp.]